MLKVINKKFFLFFSMITVFISVNSQTLTQTVRGKIVDADSESPLIGATIQIKGSTPMKAAISDMNGNFIFQDIPVGRHTLVFSYLGYQIYTLPELLVGSAKEIVLNVKLTEQIHKIEEAAIVYKREKDKTVNEMAMVSSRQFTVEETSRYAASIDDPARMSTSFAGVATTGDDIRNEIIIRGNSPRGMLWQIEGVPVPNPNHFANEGSTGGAVCIISNNVLDNSDFLTGAWPAQYSNAISGVFDIKLRNGNNQKREYAFQLGLLGIDFAAEGPFSEKSNASYLINYRYSTLSLFDKLGIHIVDERDGIPTFQDLTFKINLPTNKAGIFSLWGIGGNSSQYTKSIIAFDTTYEGKKYNYLSYSGYATNSFFGATGISNKYFIDNRSYINTSMVFTGSKAFNESDGRLEPGMTISKIGKDYQEDIRQGQIIFLTEYKRKINSKLTVQSGIRYRTMLYNVLVNTWDYDSLHFDKELDKDGSMDYLEVYAQNTYKLNENFELYTGLNFNQLLSNNKNSLEPRLALSWKFFGNQSLTFGFGIHSQLQSMALYLVDVNMEDGTKIPVNENLDFNKAAHYVLTYNNLLLKELRLKVDLYYQNLYQIPIPKDTVNNSNLKTYSVINDADWFTFVPLVNKGTGRNYGLEISLEKFFSKGWYGLINTSFFESKYTASDNIERDTRFNYNYIVNAVGGKEFKIRNNILGTNIKFTQIGGRRHTPVKNTEVFVDENGQPVLNFVTGEEIILVYYDYSKAFSEKMKDYSRIDASLFYRINMRRMAHIFTIEFQNLLNVQNIGGLSHYDTKKNEYVYWYQPGLIPIFKYRLEF